MFFCIYIYIHIITLFCNTPIQILYACCRVSTEQEVFVDFAGMRPVGLMHEIAEVQGHLRILTQNRQLPCPGTSLHSRNARVLRPVVLEAP